MKLIKFQKIALILILLFSTSVFAGNFSNDSEDYVIEVYFFWGEGCPYCETQKPFLAELEQKYDDLEVKAFEVYSNSENMKLFSDVAEAYGTTPRGVPATFIGDKYWIGFSDYMKPEMESYIEECIESGCPNPGGLSPKTDPSEDVKGDEFTPLDNNTEEVLNIPFFGEIDISSMSLALITFLIAFIDGINPCSLWVLTFLMGIVIYTKSRKKVMIIGLTFLLVTASAYGVFILGMINVFSYIGYLFWIKILVAFVAILVGLVNIKDYFWYKKGISFTIPDKFKPKIFKDVRKIMKGESSMTSMIIATIIMALGIVLIELPCTAGFPIIWSGIIASRNVEMLTFAFMFFIYIMTYLLLEIIIFATFAITLKSTKFGQKSGRIFKLIGGMIMLALAFALVFMPDLMNDIGGALSLFGIAFILSLFVMVIHRKILPKFGIIIGTEKDISNDKLNESEEGENNG